MTMTATKHDNGDTIPNRFEPPFWESADGRCAVIKELRRRYAELIADTGADSFQKRLLCQRAIFLAVQIETMEITAAEDGTFEAGVYTQAVNALSGLLSKLGLDKRQTTGPTLDAYVEGKRQ